MPPPTGMRTARWAPCGLGLVLAGHVLAAGPPTSTALLGVWMPIAAQPQLAPADGGPVPFTAEGRTQFARNQAQRAATAGATRARDDLTPCEPLGPTRLLQQPFPMQILRERNRLVLLYEHNHTFETVYLGEVADADRDPAYMGSSAGRVTADGADVDTVSFNGRTWLDDAGLPHSGQLRLHRRYVVASGGASLTVETTVTDPVMFSTPWTLRQRLTRAVGGRIEEFTCGQGPTLDTRYTRARAAAASTGK